MNRAATIGLLLLALGLLLMRADIRTPATQADSPWVTIGAATADDGGAWRFGLTVGRDLLGAGATFLRVSGTALPSAITSLCDLPLDQAVVFEAQLQPTQAGDGSWAAQLAPVSAAAQALTLDPTSGDVQFVPTADGTNIEAALDGVPPTMTFAVCLRQSAASAPAATASPWALLGFAASDDGGAWRFKQSVGQDLLGAGLTVIRVTSGSCDTSVEQAVVFEAQLGPTQSADGSWGGLLRPVGTPAQDLPSLDPTSGDVHVVPTPAGTQIDAALDGIPPDTSFTVCLRQP